jgi:hypothetical protein
VFKTLKFISQAPCPELTLRMQTYAKQPGTTGPKLAKLYPGEKVYAEI